MIKKLTKNWLIKKTGVKNFLNEQNLPLSPKYLIKNWLILAKNWLKKLWIKFTTSSVNIWLKNCLKID